jgi:hypothetical protein
MYVNATARQPLMVQTRNVVLHSRVHTAIQSPAELLEVPNNALQIQSH